TQLRPGAVTADKIRKNAVTAPKIESLAVKQGKIATAAITAEKIADGAVGTAELATGGITGQKIADDTVTGANVNESSLARVPSAAHADVATFAEASDPEAFAKVSQEGTVDSANSRGLATANVKQPKDGLYCIKVPGFVPEGAQVTPQYTGNVSVLAFVTLGGTEQCTFPEIEVQMHSGGLIKAPFYIVVYR
ncbi:MAG TPA: hypothetical protein VHR65_00255, partial [Solirubrobacterales bacterium]|nr:hypothetical protein [Solirubrobacterales bacterium]